MPISRCYLCGKSIPAGLQTDDHVVPQVLRGGQPPKIKGYDYGGVLPSHRRCNNEFGPEDYVIRALELIDALHRPEGTTTLCHPNDNAVRLMAINSECLKNFRAKDLAYFRISNQGTKPIPPASHFLNAEPVDPYRQSLDVALAVLLKSAAAILVKRKLKSVPTGWQVMAVTYVGDTVEFDLDEIFGKTKPFSKNVKIWAGMLVTGDGLVVYRTARVIVYFFFRLSTQLDGWRRMRSQFVNCDRLRFDGNSIREVLRTGWRRI